MRSVYFFVITIVTFTNCQSQPEYSCPFPYQSYQPEDECGFVEVPRNWDKDGDETTKIAYLVIRSKSNKRKEDPVVFLQGGPGGIVLDLADVYSQLNLDNNRDFILFDQRGVGFSEELCPNLNLKLLEIMSLDFDINEETKALKKVVSSCSRYLKADGRQFSTTTNAKDLEALRKHLGYSKLNIFGGSYGTRLGLKYIELYPKHVRSAILSGLFPPEIRMYDNLFSNFNNALSFVFSKCKSDKNCNTRYPKLASEFLDSYSYLEKHPISIQLNGDTFVLNQQDILLLMHQMLYRNDTAEHIPKFIYALREKDKQYISKTFASFIPKMTLINLGVYYSIMTADEGNFNNKEKVSSDSKNLMFPDIEVSLFSTDVEIIKAWPSVKVESNAMSPVTSEVPTLLISGDLDPVTPPHNGNIVAKSLSNYQHLVFRNNGHVPINECFFNLAKQFIDNPVNGLNDNCITTTTILNWD